MCSEFQLVGTANIELMFILLVRHQPNCCKNVSKLCLSEVIDISRTNDCFIHSVSETCSCY